jgi:AcrR family transcriptional regulator
VARSRPEGRFQQLHDAALRVFAAKGLRRARMADVAREMGVATGSLYNYVESKEALFHWLVALGPTPAAVAEPGELPIRTPPPGATARLLRRQLARGFRLASLDAALARRRVTDARAELEGIVRELYERVEQTRGPGAAVERSAIDQPELFDAYFRGARRTLLASLARYLERRAKSGHLARIADPGVAARFVVEAVAWFGRHRHSDADPFLLADDATIREEVVRRVVASFVPE